MTISMPHFRSSPLRKLQRLRLPPRLRQTTRGVPRVGVRAMEMLDLQQLLGMDLVALVTLIVVTLEPRQLLTQVLVRRALARVRRQLQEQNLQGPDPEEMLQLAQMPAPLQQPVLNPLQLSLPLNPPMPMQSLNG